MGHLGSGTAMRPQGRWFGAGAQLEILSLAERSLHAH